MGKLLLKELQEDGAAISKPVVLGELVKVGKGALALPTPELNSVEERAPERSDTSGCHPAGTP